MIDQKSRTAVVEFRERIIRELELDPKGPQAEKIRALFREFLQALPQKEPAHV